MTEQKTSEGIRWSRVVLVASLALNIVVLGIVGGAALRWDKGRDHVRTVQVRDIGIGPFMGAFAPEQRRELGRAFARSAGNPREARQEAQGLFEDMLGLLRSDPFDAAQFETHLLTLQSGFADRQEIGTRLMIAKISEMSPEARMAYADKLDDLLKRPPVRPGDRKPPHGADQN